VRTDFSRFTKGSENVAMVTKFIKEPITHLLVVGVVLFYSFDSLNPEQGDQGQYFSQGQLVSQEQVNRLLEDEAKGQALTSIPLEQRRGLIEDFLDAEILYQEAKRLKLDHDAFIRDRLVKKAKFYVEGQYVVPEVQEPILQAFYRANKSRYLKKTTVSFSHRILNAAGVSRAKTLLSRPFNEQGFLSEIATMQKASFVSLSFTNADLDELSSIFGTEFVDGVSNLPIGFWNGLVESELGFHVVKVSDRQQEGYKSFAEVKDKVKEDWIAAQRTHWVKQKIASLRGRYGLAVEDFLFNE